MGGGGLDKPTYTGDQDAAGECYLRVRVKSFQSGRVKVNAITFSAPNAKNKSVDTKSLYSLAG